MFWRGSIQRRLFLSYSAVVLTLIVLFALLAYAYISRTLARNATDYMLVQADRIGFETDALLDDANKLSGKLLFSQDLLDLFYSDMFQYKSDSVAKQHEFNGLIYSIIGPQSPPYQINLFRPSGEFAGFGLTALITNQHPATIASIPWLQECLGRDGSKLIVTTHMDDFAYQRQPVVSLCRAFASRWGRPKDSINEIQVPYSQIDSVVQRQLVGTQGGQVFIFDAAGGLVFPPGPLPSAAAYFEAVTQATGPATVTRSIDGRLQVLAHRPTQVGDWTVVVTRDYDSVFEPVRRFRNGAMLASAAVLFLTLLVTYAISRSLTRPIKQMHQSVAQLTLETLPDEKAFKIETNVNELQELSSAFQTMTIRLRESVQDAVAARSSALQARLLALQAQMNPHFLYNMLTTVSILAEKGKSQQVVTVCDSLSDMMRYISAGGAQLVTVAEELHHAQLYAELMGVRFADDLTFVFDVPGELMAVMLPRLTIQPLIENSAKYGTTCAPPWRITVTGTLNDGRWTITVSDTGLGFSPAALENLSQKLARSAGTAAPEVLGLDGMGLLNIYGRLTLYYGADGVFEFGNHPGGGAYVTIGGSITLAKKVFDVSAGL
jgi:two-component system sensor histidine kinase YesM